MPHAAISQPARPRRLVIEATTRCNLRCPHCVKHTGPPQPERELDADAFDALAPLLPALESLVFGGVGEPLLHPRLPAMVAGARDRMPAAASIGLQTNASLLHRHNDALADAGLTTACLSLDAADPETFGRLRPGGHPHQVARGLADLVRRGVRAGVQATLRKDTLRVLPLVLDFAAKHGASFVILSHLLPYAAADADLTAHPQDCDAAVDLLQRWRGTFRAEGLDPRQHLRAFKSLPVTTTERRAAELLRAMLDEAARQGAPLNLERLLNHDPQPVAALEEALAESRAVAERHGLELILPSTLPKRDRRCDFVEDHTLFVAADGGLHPCPFLWRDFACHPGGRRKPVGAKRFGQLPRHDPTAVWNSPDYAGFRKEVTGYDYPHCGNCSLAPCNLVDTAPFQNDCHAATVPCGDCPWNQGLLQCLR